MSIENVPAAAPTANDTLMYISPEMIDKNPDEYTLRDPDEDTVAFKNMLESIATPVRDESGRVVSDHGLNNPIVVRPMAGRPGHYAIVDGLHRLTCWKKAFGEKKPIPSFVKNLSDLGVLEAQLIANVQRVATKRAQSAKHLLKIFEIYPERTIAEEAAKLHIDAPALKQWLSLAKLPENMQHMVDEGTLPASVAYKLAKFKEPANKKNQKEFWDTKRNEWFDRYQELKDQSQGLVTFLKEVAAGFKSAQKAVNEGRTSTPTNIEDLIVPVVRKRSEIEIEERRVKEALDTSGAHAVEYDPNNEDQSAIYQQGYYRALQWVLRVDPTTKAQRVKDLQDKEKAKKDAADARKAGEKADSIARSQGH